MEQSEIFFTRKQKLTTVALEANEFLKPVYHSSIVETYCRGYYVNDEETVLPKRDLNGHYFTKELNLRP